LKTKKKKKKKKKKDFNEFWWISFNSKSSIILITKTYIEYIIV